MADVQYARIKDIIARKKQYLAELEKVIEGHGDLETVPDNVKKDLEQKAAAHRAVLSTSGWDCGL